MIWVGLGIAVAGFFVGLGLGHLGDRLADATREVRYAAWTLVEGRRR